MKHLIVIILAAALMSCGKSGRLAGKADFTPLDSMITSWIDRNYYPGAAIAVADKDSVLFEKMYGGYTPSTKVHVASAGKWVAAAVIAAVVDHTRLSWDDTVAQWLPEFKDDVKGGITLRQLLSHTSGIPNYHKPPKRDTYNSLDSAVTDILPLDTVFSPGTRFQYGGLAMQVAGRMAEVAGGECFEQLYYQYIAWPLGMEHSHFIPVDKAEGHNPMLGGGFTTTLHDYMLFLNMIFHDGQYDGKCVLTANSVRAMQSNQINKAKIEHGEYVEKALGLRHKSIYGLGEWREKIDDNGSAYQISSPGWAGAYPWINRKEGVYGFFITHVEGSSAAKDGFSPFYNAPQISGMVTKIMEEKEQKKSKTLWKTLAHMFK